MQQFSAASATTKTSLTTSQLQPGRADGRVSRRLPADGTHQTWSCRSNKQKSRQSVSQSVSRDSPPSLGRVDLAAACGLQLHSHGYCHCHCFGPSQSCWRRRRRRRRRRLLLLLSQESCILFILGKRARAPRISERCV